MSPQAALPRSTDFLTVCGLTSRSTAGSRERPGRTRPPLGGTGPRGGHSSTFARRSRRSSSGVEAPPERLNGQVFNAGLGEPNHPILLLTGLGADSMSHSPRSRGPATAIRAPIGSALPRRRTPSPSSQAIDPPMLFVRSMRHFRTAAGPRRPRSARSGGAATSFLPLCKRGSSLTRGGPLTRGARERHVARDPNL